MRHQHRAAVALHGAHRGVHVRDVEVRHPARPDTAAPGPVTLGRDPAEGRLPLVAVLGAQHPVRHPGRLHLLAAPAEHPAVEGDGRDRVRCVQLHPDQRVLLRGHPQAAGLARLPRGELGALRVGELPEPPLAHHVHRLHPDGAAAVPDGRGGGLDVRGHEVHHPGGLRTLLGERPDRGDGLAALLEEAVPAGLGAAWRRSSIRRRRCRRRWRRPRRGCRGRASWASRYGSRCRAWVLSRVSAVVRRTAARRSPPPCRARAGPSGVRARRAGGFTRTGERPGPRSRGRAGPTPSNLTHRQLQSTV